MANAKYPAQLVGTEQTMSRTPVASPSSNAKSGQFQMTGTEQKMSSTPISSPSSNPRSGEFQMVGTETTSRVPFKIKSPHHLHLLTDPVFSGRMGMLRG